MPVLGRNEKTEEQAAREGLPAAAPGRWLSTCANPACATGWLQLWRRRTAPVFEGGWTCSAECTRARVATAVAREMAGWTPAREPHRHRVPLGLLLLEQRWIGPNQLRRALEAQREAGAGRLGEWLMRQGALSEERLTQALGLQWNCPVLPLEYHDAQGLAALMPRLFLDAFGALPVRVAAGRVLYLGFEQTLDPVLALGLERMLELRVECGIVAASQFRPGLQRMLEAEFPRVELIETAGPAAAARALARSIERARPLASRLVRVHDCLWLRMSKRTGNGLQGPAAAVEDVVCSIGGL